VGDACGANARLAQRSGGRIEHASCNAHARREFVAAESNEPVLAAQAESLYRQLYAVEERGKTLTPDQRWALRQRDAVPIWSRIRQWLDSVPVQRVLPKSALGKAVGYLRNQWSALQVYLRDGRLPIDNDQSEQTIRPLTVGRSNWLFLGHPRAAAGRLQLYSIVSSAHRHHLVIQDYLEDVLRRLADAQQNHPSDLELGAPYLLDLLPDRWALPGGPLYVDRDLRLLVSGPLASPGGLYVEFRVQAKVSLDGLQGLVPLIGRRSVDLTAGQRLD
jgi:hypothetical protein